MTTIDNEIRYIESSDAPDRYARGWHCLGLLRDFRDGKPHTVNAFGEKLVVFSGEDGKINVLDAYCRHMGADLSTGTIKGNEIACPFHDWRWGGDGKCKSIPYSRRVPLRARTAAWPAMEHAGMLFVWNDPEGNPPIAEQMIPEIAGYGKDDWTDWHWYTTTIEGSNCREIVDNVVDMAHFFYVHHSFPMKFKNIFEGHVAWQYMDGQGRQDTKSRPAGSPQVLGNSSVAGYFGPSFMIDELTYHYEGMDIEAILINCHYPVSPTSFVLQYGIIVQQTDKLSKEAAAKLSIAMGDFIKIGFEQDVTIWKSKARIDNPLLCEEDGPVYQLRRWYEQFYVDVADISPDMTDRFEQELDTTKPNETWAAEVEENLRRRQQVLGGDATNADAVEAGAAVAAARAGAGERPSGSDS